jgi:uncharacterized peroxidase-related enzyme
MIYTYYNYANMWIDENTNKLPLISRIILFFQKKRFGFELNPTKAWGKVPVLMFAMNFFFKIISRKKSLISEALRTLISVRISQINECDFCIDMNSYLYAQATGQMDKINALSFAQTSEHFTDQEKVALEYAENMTHTNRTISDSLKEKLKLHFSDKAIVELTAIIAFQNMSSKFNAALDVKNNGFCKIK